MLLLIKRIRFALELNHHEPYSRGYLRQFFPSIYVFYIAISFYFCHLCIYLRFRGNVSSEIKLSKQQQHCDHVKYCYTHHPWRVNRTAVSCYNKDRVKENEAKLDLHSKNKMTLESFQRNSLTYIKTSSNSYSCESRWTKSAKILALVQAHIVSPYLM